MSRDKLPIVVLRGSARERGQQHGSELAKLIIDALTRLRQRAGVRDWDRARTWGAASLDYVYALAPDIHDELEGIAATTGLSVLDIYLLSCFEYFPEARSGCTSAAFAGSRGAVVAQNWDASDDEQGGLAIFIHIEPGQRFMTVASAGTLGWVGMNGNGFAFVNNDLVLDEARGGLPSLVIRRMMLVQGSVDAAIGVLQTHRHMSGRSFLLGDALGNLQLAEVGPSAGLTHRSFHHIVHTNHPLFPEPAMWENVEAVARLYPSSRDRLRAARKFELTSTGDVVALLRDRTGAPDAICKSSSEREPTATAFSAIFGCGRQEAMISLGRPDEMTYQRICLAQLVGV